MKRWLSATLLAMLLALRIAAPTLAAEPDTFIAQMLDQAKAADCARPSDDQLVRILCAGVVRIGVRSDYKSFGLRSNGIFRGFEIDLAALIAERLGVRLQLEAVTPANRIPFLANGTLDIVIATMGHTVSRDHQITFVEPHYYAAPTSVVGPRSMKVSGWSDIAGRSVCVPIGNFSNVLLAQHFARLMIFDGPDHLLDALRLNVCSLVAHDHSLLVANVTGPDADPGLAKRFDEKFSFAPIPWGIGLPQTGAANLSRLLGLLTISLDRSGALIALAEKHHVDDEFLKEQQRLWSGSDCYRPDGTLTASCLLEPVDVEEKPTKFAPLVRAFEKWNTAETGWTVSFPMFTGQDSLKLFIAGIVNSLIIVGGAITATLGVALLFQFGLRSHLTPLRLMTRALVTVVQCSPVILLLVLGYLVVTAVLSFSTAVAMLTAIIVIGLSNGSFAASAIVEAAASLPAGTRLLVVLRLAATQIRAFMINAARASAIASFIGVPELLAALTDITSFTSERRTTYVMLLVFYMATVLAVVALTGAVVRRLEPRGARVA